VVQDFVLGPNHHHHCRPSLLAPNHLDSCQLKTRLESIPFHIDASPDNSTQPSRFHDQNRIESNDKTHAAVPPRHTLNLIGVRDRDARRIQSSRHPFWLFLPCPRPFSQLQPSATRRDACQRHSPPEPPAYSKTDHAGRKEIQMPVLQSGFQSLRA
jgi:hypothetical protein